MGATTPYAILKSTSGQVVSVNLYYAGGDLAGYQVPASLTGVASAANHPSFVLPEGIWAIQHITGPATGKIRLWCNSQPGPVALDMAALIAMVAAGNTYGAFRGGSKFQYMFVVESTMAA